MDYTLIALLVLFGFVGGFIGGMIGIGGGIFFVLILPEALHSIGVEQGEIAQFVVANSLFAIFFTSLAGSIRLQKQKMIYPREILIVGGVSIVTAGLVLKLFVNTPAFNKTTFNFILIGLLLFMLSRTLLSARKNDATGFPTLSNLKLGTVGFFSGLVAPLSGLGGGIIIIPILNGLHKMEVRFANAISLGVIGITAGFATIVNLLEHPASITSGWQMGYIAFPIALSLSVGVVLGSPQGIKVSRKMKAQHINYLFALFIIITLVKKLYEVLV